MKGKLRLWGLKIENLAAKTTRAGDRARFDNLMHIDELKALHAIAQSKFDELRSGETTDRTRLETEVESTLNELADVFRRPPR